MKAVVCRAFGPFSDLRIEHIDSPALRSGAVRIRIAVAAANPPDNLMAQGKYQVRPELPFVVGVEGAGVVTEVAADVDGLKVGDRVMTYAGIGCFAEEVVVDAALVYPVPSGMSLEQAAGFALVYGAAYHGLVDRGGLREGETVAVLGAAGGLGLSAIQVAKALGARVIAVASTREKLAVCAENGADAVVLSSDESLRDRLREFGDGRGVHVVHDTVGGPLSLQALRGLRPYGRHLIVGYSSGEIPQMPANYILLKQVSAIGVSFRQCAQDNPGLAQQGIRALADLWRAGKLNPAVARVHPFEAFTEAMGALSSRAAIGKHLIRISAD